MRPPVKLPHVSSPAVFTSTLEPTVAYATSRDGVQPAHGAARISQIAMLSVRMIGRCGVVDGDRSSARWSRGTLLLHPERSQVRQSQFVDPEGMNSD